MKAFYAILFVLVSLVGSVYGQITNGFPRGADLEKYSLAQVTRMEVFIRQGGKTLLPEGYANATFNNRADLEGLFQKILKENAGGLLTKQVGQDKDEPFYIGATASQYYWDENDQQLIVRYFEVTAAKFSLVKTGTNYALPDFSGVKMDFPDRIGYAVNHLKWISLTASNGNETIFDTDSTVPSPDTTVEEVKLRRGISYVFISKDIVLNKDVDIRIRTLTSDSTGQLRFQVFDGGHEVAPNPLSLTVTKYPPPSPDGAKAQTGPPTPQALIRVIGGERGMTVQIQSSTDLVNWIDVPTARFTLSLYGVPSYEEKAGGSQSFYRVALVE